MDEELSLDEELQNAIELVQSTDMDETLHFHIPSTSAEEVDINGDQAVTHDRNEFLSLPNASFQNRDDFIRIVREIGLKQGYVMVIKRSKANAYVIMGCDRGGKYRGAENPPEKKKNKSSSRLIDCPFRIVGKRNSEQLWTAEIKTLCHNHEPSFDMSGHPYCRRFTEEEALRIKQMSMAGIQARHILTAIRESNPHALAISRTVYSKTAQFRRESLGGRSIIQALLEDLGEAGFSHNVKYDQGGSLTHLFLAHPTSIELTKSYPHVFVMDCTYKTNKYKMPLLDIVGVTSFNTSFFSCFVFMQKEEEEDYVWALQMFSKLLGHDKYPLVILTDRELALMNAIKHVFPRTPNLLCIWHIEKNIVAHCKGHFNAEADWDAFLKSWTIVLQSPDESTFADAWERFQVEYKDNAVDITYIKDTWLPWKENFVHAWTGQVTHFGNHATSRGEGAHAVLKMYLQVSTGGLREVKHKMCLAIRNQFQEIRTKLSSEKIRVPQRFHIPFFKQLIGNVSVYALDKLLEQYKSATTKESLPKCKGHFFKTMGLPCVHMIREMNCEVLPLNKIHKQWRINTTNFSSDHGNLDHGDPFNGLLFELADMYKKLPIAEKENTIRQLSQMLGASPPLIFEPTMQPHKGRPVGSKNKKRTTSTKREPSLFEIKEKTARKCSICSLSGHNCSTCPLKNKPPGMPSS